MGTVDFTQKRRHVDKLTTGLYAGTIICTVYNVELEGCPLYNFSYKPLDERSHLMYTAVG